jgi:glyoxylase I family protein
MAEVLGVDHIYITVRDMARSEAFYDKVLEQALGFRKNRFDIGGDPHVQYYCRHFGYVIRPARSAAAHDPYSPGLHHLCLRVESIEDVESVARRLQAAGIEATPAALHPGYAPDYWATFFTDPDGVRLEVTNFWQMRRDRHDRWEELGRTASTGS